MGMMGSMVEKKQEKPNVIFLARHKITGQQYSLRIDKKAYSSKIDEDLVHSITSPYIVRVHYDIKTRTKRYILFDYLPCGRLYYHLKYNKKLDEDRVQFYVREILLGK